MVAEASSPEAVPPARGRCRCGHLPTHHMVVRPVGRSGNYRLVPAGPCEVCGSSACRGYAPGVPP